MAENANLNQLKQKYRSRYCGNRLEDVPEIKPGENALSFVSNYLTVTASTSHCEDDDRTNVVGPSVSARSTAQLREDESDEEYLDDSPQAGVDDEPQTSQGYEASVRGIDPPAMPSTSTKDRGQRARPDDRLFTDDESDNEESHVMAKLIEQSLGESDDSNSEQVAEQLYSVNISAVQEPPSPTSKITAKKWLSFKDTTFTVGDRVSTNIVSRTSEESRQEEALNPDHGNPSRADMTYDLHRETTDERAKNDFLIEDETSSNLNAWISPSQKRTTPLLATRPKQDTATATPTKTTLMEASRSLQKKPEDVKGLVVASVPDERAQSDFLIEDESSCNLLSWISPLKSTTTSPLSTRAMEGKPTATPSKTNLVEATSSWQRTSENVQASVISSTTDERSEIDYVIEDESSNNLHSWISPVKKTTLSPLSTRAKEGKATAGQGNRNPVEEYMSLQRASGNGAASVSGTNERAESEFVIVDESSCNLDTWISPIKKTTTSPLSTRAMEREATSTTPSKRNAAEASSTVQKKPETVTASASGTAERAESEFVIVDESSCNLDTWISHIKKTTTSPLSTRAMEREATSTTPSKRNAAEASSSVQKKSETVTASASGTAERAVNEEKAHDPNTKRLSFLDVFYKKRNARHVANRILPVVPEVVAPSCTEEEFEIEDLSETSNLLTLPVKPKLGRVTKKEKIVPVVLVMKGASVESASPTEDDERSAQEAALPRVVEGTDQQDSLPVLQRVVEGTEDPEASFRQSYLPRIVEGSEEEESFYQNNDLPIDYSLKKGSVTHIRRVHQPQQGSHSARTRGESTEEMIGGSDETFTIRTRRGLGKAALKLTAQNIEESKTLKNEQEEIEVQMVVKSDVAETASRWQLRYGRARDEGESAKDWASDDPDSEIPGPSYLTRKRHANKVAKADEQTTVVAHSPPRLQRMEIVGQTTAAEAFPFPKKRKAKLKHIDPPSIEELDTEEPVFQSGPVRTRHRAVRFVEPPEPVEWDFDFTDKEADKEEDASTSTLASGFSSGEQLLAIDYTIASHTEEKRPKLDLPVDAARDLQAEFLKRYSIVYDPDTRSDALVECIAQSEGSEYVGNNFCSYWMSFNNNIFATGKLTIAPRMTSERRIFMSDIVIYYIEEGRVRLNLHKTDRILKAGDFFFVPPANCCTIDNLQDTPAVLAFCFLKMIPFSGQV